MPAKYCAAMLGGSAMGRAVAAPRDAMRLAWCVLALLVAAWAAHEGFGLGGSGTDELFRVWIADLVLWAAAALCLCGALTERRGRIAWILVALGIASWALGDTIWSMRFEHSAIPTTSISDVFWLAWYPLAIVGIALLVRDRVPRFELHRWIDGVAVMLIVATPLVALFIQPISERSTTTIGSEAIELAYVLLDTVILGAVVGVYALMGWRPGRMWLLLGLGLSVLALGDCVYSVQVLAHNYHVGGEFDVTWAAGALLIAYAAWEPHPGQIEPRPVYGWRAIALPVAAQTLAIALQIFAYFHEVPRSERLLTVLVLLIAVVQIVVTRPRASQPGDVP
jgi:hypothetical protein